MESSGLIEAPPAAAPTSALHAFSAFGVEIEYMIVDAASLDVKPSADRVLQRLAGSAHVPAEVARGILGWSNELVLHVIELKNPRPVVDLAALAADLQAEVRAIRPTLASLGMRLLPGAAHPWMDPGTEAAIWQHEGRAVYQAFDRIFDCRRHGWANVQAVHINLPFANDAEFERLHAAVRILLPLVPALAASSPFVEGRASGMLDTRMAFYRSNATKVPAVAGLVVPDTYTSRAHYRTDLLAPLMTAIAPHDPQGLLRHEWLNARGAIARFDRSAIEIRVVDVQEHPRADVALAALFADVAWWLYHEHSASLMRQQALDTAQLASTLQACSRDAERAQVDDDALLRVLGMPAGVCRADVVWRHVAEALERAGAPHRALWAARVDWLLARGTLARRLLSAAGPTPDRASLRAVYRELADCLDAGQDFEP